MSVGAATVEPVRAHCAWVQNHLRLRLPDVCVEVGVLGRDNALTDRAPARHREAGERSQPSIAVQFAGSAAVVGPAVREGDAGPCRDCLRRRWQMLRPNEERAVLERHGGTPRQIRPSPFITDFALDAIAEVAGRALQETSGTSKDRHGLVYSVELDTLRISRHPLVADPTCPTCGHAEPAGAHNSVIRLRSRMKSAVDNFRIRSVADYDFDIEAYANPVCGALGFGAFPAFESPTTAPVTGAMRMRGVFGLHEFFWSGHADQFDASRRLAVLEGLERYAGLRSHRMDSQVVDSYANLREIALDPRECGVYSDDYYSDRSYHQPFREDRVMRWVWAYSLRDERSCLVPEQLIYYGSGVLGGHQTFVMECSNGCAIGSCVEEATLFGMLELIERDAFLLSWYGRAGLPEIDPRTCASVETRIMIEMMANYGYDVRLFDNRIDIAVPVVTAVAVRRDGGLGTLCFAAGASLDPEDAVRGALCEIASYVPEFDTRTAAGLDEARAMAADFDRVQELRHHALLYGLPEMAHHAGFLLDAPGPMSSMEETYAGWRSVRPRSLDLLDDLRFVQSCLVQRGFDVIVADQTCREQRAEGLTTVCVIAPGLLPIDFGWDRQRARHMSRTRTAFRDTERWARELDRSELNTAPHPFP